MAFSGPDNMPHETSARQAPESGMGATALVLRDRRVLYSSDVPAVLSTTPNLAGLLQAIRRRWRLALLLGLVLSPAVAAGVWFSMPERHTAQTVIHIAQNPSGVLVLQG